MIFGTVRAVCRTAGNVCRLVGVVGGSETLRFGRSPIARSVSRAKPTGRKRNILMLLQQEAERCFAASPLPGARFASGHGLFGAAGVVHGSLYWLCGHGVTALRRYGVTALRCYGVTGISVAPKASHCPAGCENDGRGFLRAYQYGMD